MPKVRVGAEDGQPDENLRITPPKQWAAGVPGVFHALREAVGDAGVARSTTTLLKLNQKTGFDCPSCAWPDPPEKRKKFEFCESGAKAVGWESDKVRCGPEFFAEHSLSDLRERSEYWLGQQGRLTHPLHKAEGDDHYREVSWERAYEIAGTALRALDSPDRAIFYTSGRTSNEAAFAYQLFVRVFGTNNLPDCSNMCHESTSMALAQTIGIGKASVSYDDFAQADLIVILGQNPGTNHPRMLSALEEAKRGGTSIIAVNPLPEAGLLRFKNPQRPDGVLGRGTALADAFYQVRLGGDMALLQAVAKRVIAADDERPGTVLDTAFLQDHTTGLADLRAHLAELDEADVSTATGLHENDIDDFAARYMKAERVVFCWAMGITQHEAAVATIREIVNLAALRGNIGRPGAGLAPIRGHSNVQGDRTMGIWERPPVAFLDAMELEFGIPMPRENGLDSVDSVRAMRDGKADVFMAMGGNFVSAVSDTEVVRDALSKTRLTISVATKLNATHLVTGAESLLLPCLGRTEIDRQAGGEQFVTVEDTVCAVHASHGPLEPASPTLNSEVAIICGIAAATLGHRVDGAKIGEMKGVGVDWDALVADYDHIRDHIAHVVPGCHDYNEKVRREDGFVLPHGPRDSRTFPTLTKRLQLTANDLSWPTVPPGRLLLQTIRSHDQFNTTIYGLDDRYRGVHGGRRVVFVHPDDLARLGIPDGASIDVTSEWRDGALRQIRGFRAVSFPTARGCAAAYFPEANALVPLDSVATGSNTPTSKAVVVTLALHQHDHPVQSVHTTP